MPLPLLRLKLCLGVFQSCDERRDEFNVSRREVVFFLGVGGAGAGVGEEEEGDALDDFFLGGEGVVVH
jgi:hypothetical protein